MLAIGNQLWPQLEQFLPGFIDLSVGVILPQTGMTGMPGAAWFVRIYLGLGW
jgi:hypothetical protein